MAPSIAGQNYATLKFIFSLACAFKMLIISPSSLEQTSRRSVFIGSMTSKPNAVLVLNPSDNNQGFLLPQLSTNSRLAMTPTSPDEDGLMVFDITEKQFYYWKNRGWVKGFGGNG